MSDTIRKIDEEIETLDKIIQYDKLVTDVAALQEKLIAKHKEILRLAGDLL